VHDDVNFRALRHPNERARILQRLAPFAQSVYRQSFAFLALGMPLPFAKLYGYRQYTVAKFTRGSAIIVGSDPGQAIGGA
jgi:hypothetical protein